MKCDWCGHELTILDVEWGRCICDSPIPLAVKELIETAHDAESEPHPDDEYNADYLRAEVSALCAEWNL